LGSESLPSEQEVDGLGLAALKIPAVTTRPELELLFCCTRMGLDPTSVQRIRSLLREDIDWSYVLQTASRWRVRPLLYRNLDAICPESVPKAILAQLSNHFHTNVQRNLFLVGELVKLLRLFEIQGIPAIPFKGPVLAASVYSNLALRECGDLDLLVRKQDVTKAKSLLISAGYRSTGQLTETQEMACLKSHLGYHLEYDDGNVGVELHWRVTPAYFAFPFDLDCLWKDLEPTLLAGMTIRHLSPQESLLILCVHGARHRWDRLSWICDIAELVHTHEELDWGRVLAKADGLGCKRMLFLGLFLANNLLEADLPDKVRSKIQVDPMVEPLATQVVERLVSEGGDSRGGTEWHTYHLRIKERWRDRFSYLLHWGWYRVAPDTKNQTGWPLSPLLSVLYYLLRPIRLVREYRWDSLKYLWALFRHFVGL
jgi:hypothetical protein